MISSKSMSLSDALSQFLLTLEAEGREAQGDLNAFIRWCGRGRPVNSLTPPEIEGYAQQLSQGVVDSDRRLQRVRSFLSYLKKSGLLEQNLAPHVRIRKTQGPATTSRKATPGTVALTADGHAQLKAQLEELKGERVKVAEEIRKAAADKDFRENAPLEAARDHQGHVESRIRELEAILGVAQVVKEPGTLKVAQARLGSTVALHDVATGNSMSYILVDPSEANPSQGKLSVASPLGKALLGHGTGEEVEVLAPRGAQRYHISEIS